MMLDQLFQRYLTECSYKHADIDEDELEIEMELEVEQVNVEIEYNEIPEITRSVVTELRKKKISSVLTKVEEASLEKFWFQHMLTDKNIWNKDIEIDLWDVYKDYGKGKFNNMSYEKGFKDGSVRICDIVSEVYPEISGRLALRVELIDEMCTTLGLRHSQDFSEVSKEKVESCVNWFKTNKQRIHSVFEIRDQTKSATFDSKATLYLINKVFSKWGYSKVKSGKKSGKRVDGKMKYSTPYNVSNEKKDIDVYEHVKAKKIKQTERKLKIVKKGNHPLD
jgi:hypothetical protein